MFERLKAKRLEKILAKHTSAIESLSLDESVTELSAVNVFGTNLYDYVVNQKVNEFISDFVESLSNLDYTKVDEHEVIDQYKRETSRIATFQDQDLVSYDVFRKTDVHEIYETQVDIPSKIENKDVTLGVLTQLEHMLFKVGEKDVSIEKVDTGFVARYSVVVDTFTDKIDSYSIHETTQMNANERFEYEQTMLSSHFGFR